MLVKCLILNGFSKFLVLQKPSSRIVQTALFGLRFAELHKFVGNFHPCIKYLTFVLDI